MEMWKVGAGHSQEPLEAQREFRSAWDAHKRDDSEFQVDREEKK
jgi:hypothetical protein